MATPEQVRAEVSTLTSGLIATGICVDQNFPSVKPTSQGVVNVGYSGLDELAITLKNIHYRDAYAVLVERRAYNMRFLDGGITQLLYTFSETNLVKHRLAFFPSPDLLEYQNNSDLYDDDDLYADVIEKNVVTVPVQFDFDPASFIEVAHPMSHLTIGQYTNCRIPVSAPLTPFMFLQFILMAFYNTPFRNLCDGLRSTAPMFGRTIVGKESDFLHVKVGLV